MEQHSLVTITTPYQILLKESVDYLTVPGADGEFGILPAHESMISELKSGIVTVVTKNDKKEFFISSGIIKIENSKIGLLVDFGINIKNADKQEVIDKLEQLKSELDNTEQFELQAVIAKSIQEYESLLYYL